MPLIPTDAATTIALASLVISLCTVGVSFAAFRKGGPKVKATCDLVSQGADRPSLELEVINTGRGDTTIDVEHLDVEWMYNHHRVDTERFSPQFDGGLPVRLAANSSVKMRAPATGLLTYQGPGQGRYVTGFILYLRIGGRLRKIANKLPQLAPEQRRRELPHKPLT